jgi:hypothetical protein
MSNSKQALEENPRLQNFFIKLPTVAVLLPIQGISIFIWWVAGSYFGIDTYTSKIFPGADGWCDPLTQGLGNHCWGDYYYTLVFLNLENPFLGEIPTPYPAAALMPFMLFQLLTNVTGIANLGVFAYIFFMAGTISFSVWLATKSQSFEKRVAIFSTLVLLSPAVIAALDRGNSVGFLVPAAIWLLSSIKRGNGLQTAFSLALLSVIKPHFGLVGLAYILAGRVKLGIQGLGLGAVINILPFLIFWPRDFPGNILSWLQVFFRYQDYGSVAGLWPQNISFAQFIYSFVYSLNSLSEGFLESTLGFIQVNQGIFGPVILLFVYLVIFFFRKTLTLTQVSILALSSITMTSAVSWYYYVVIVIPFLLFLENDKRDNSQLEAKEGRHKKTFETNESINLALWSASIFSLVQLPVPGLFSGGTLIASGIFVGGLWIMCFLAVLSVLIRDRGLTRRQKKTINSSFELGT